MDDMKKRLAAYAAGVHDELFDLTCRLCGIPAPSHHEEKRAAFCLNWLKECGIENAYIDEALNVIWPYNVKNGEKMLVIAAHTDTVFPDETPFSVTVRDGRAYCPGIGDDTAQAAELMMIMKFFAKEKPETECGILFVLNSCEEGLGNLKGIRQIFRDFEGRVREFATIDSHYKAFVNKAVGSHRYRIGIDTEGGHSFGAFGNRNAIERMARLIGRLYAVEVPNEPNTRTTYNVGSISGGTSVNTIAQHAEMLYEYRSDSRECLVYMKAQFERIIEETRGECLALKVELLGERPCGAAIDEEAQSRLVSRVTDAIFAVTGETAHGHAGSTDCNIPLSLGIPAVCLGGVDGRGAHTYEESIGIEALKPGFDVVRRFVGSYIKA